MYHSVDSRQFAAVAIVKFYLLGLSAWRTTTGPTSERAGEAH
jgi:hypothetical protein